MTNCYIFCGGTSCIPTLTLTLNFKKYTEIMKCLEAIKQESEYDSSMRNADV
jgi:hypothetical protein